MKVVHEDIDGNVLVFMRRSEWSAATGDAAAVVGSEAEVLSFGAMEGRLRKVYRQLSELLAEPNADESLVKDRR